MFLKLIILNFQNVNNNLRTIILLFGLQQSFPTEILLNKIKKRDNVRIEEIKGPLF